MGGVVPGVGGGALRKSRASAGEKGGGRPEWVRHRRRPGRSGLVPRYPRGAPAGAISRARAGGGRREWRGGGGAGRGRGSRPEDLGRGRGGGMAPDRWRPGARPSPGVGRGGGSGRGIASRQALGQLSLGRRGARVGVRGGRPWMIFDGPGAEGGEGADE